MSRNRQSGRPQFGRTLLRCLGGFYCPAGVAIGPGLVSVRLMWGGPAEVWRITIGGRGPALSPTTGFAASHSGRELRSAPNRSTIVGATSARVDGRDACASERYF